ncbi:MAG: Uma2 family endonuclease [Thermodesulfovibrionales bacterium]|nr:Uma2 family endonuclease [Thermodesulfovibrionales bacterium]
MRMLIDKQVFTYNDLTHLPEGNYEIIDGERRDMTPTGFEHGHFEGKFYEILTRHMKDKGYAAVGEIGILIAKKPLRLRAADVVYISKEKSPQRPKGMLEIAPDLIIEIISESNAAWEIMDKVKDYLSIGVERIILIDPLTQTVSLYQKGKKEAILYSFDEEFPLIENLQIKIKELLSF